MVATMPSQTDYDGLIKEDKVHTSLYHSPEVFQEELDRIWYSQWIFIGHESEVPNPGDFRTGMVGQQPIIIVRDQQGRLNVFYNRCRHRGNTVCQLKRGNARVFTCAYHGWTYDVDGSLKGVPFEEGYHEILDHGDLGLTPIPRVDSYRGFLFANLSPVGPSLDEHLGFAKANIDRFCDVSPTGELDMSAGVFKIKLRANWKMWMENSVDSYHVPTTHGSNIYIYRRNVRAQSSEELKQSNRSVQGLVMSRDLGNGHTELDFRGQRRVTGMSYTGEWSEEISPEAQREFKEAMEGFHGKEKAERIEREGPSHTVIFPNLFFMLQEIRWCVPVSVDETNLYYAPCLLKGAPEEVNTMRLRRDEGGYGPAGFQLADDIEIWERNYRGLRTRGDEWILMNRGFGQRPEVDEEGVLAQPDMSEITMRGQWTHYKRIMTLA
jgi:phenylpropionate dioxygenase-like ring-hydroxylating dioxygenase large terminal subunit